MAVASGKHEVRPAAWLKETWQWRVECKGEITYFMTERAAKRFVGYRGSICSRMSRREYDDREMDDGTIHQGTE